jgi:Tfp pilus assembly protein PilX
LTWRRSFGQIIRKQENHHLPSPMKNKLFGFMRTNRKGLALISVLGVVTLATILILALFSVSDAEFKAARNYSDGTMARQLADSAVNMVIGQIQAGATGSGASGSSGVGGSLEMRKEARAAAAMS